MPMLLEFRNLTVFRDEMRVLDRFSLAIPARQNVAILGPTSEPKGGMIPDRVLTAKMYEC